ncbi:MAG: hypothetical protein ACRDA0_03870 [Cetobacterium sp.]|uniref:hypothetical protein n=1 Tax=Cetobacterium sp. TaxID=2071632 RepID=UPI003F2CB093
MKKLTLLFLALSAVAFGASSSSITTKTDSNTVSSNSAKIDVNVTAVVTDNSTTEFIITDSNGDFISSVNFNHEVTSGDVSKDILTNEIYARGSTLTSGTISKLSTNFGSDSLVLTNGTGEENYLTSALSANLSGDYSNELGAKYTISSTLSGKADNSRPYAGQSTTLTITYDKTTK